MKQVSLLLTVIGMIAGAAGLILSFGKDSLLAAVCAGGLALSVMVLVLNFNNNDCNKGK